MKIYGLKVIAQSFLGELINNRYHVLRTKYEFLDNLLDGPSIISIVARPQIGKTILLDLLVKDIISRNEHIHGVLMFQLEMTAADIVQRDMIRLGLNYKDKEHIIRYIKYIEEKMSNIHIIDQCGNINDMYNTAIQYIKEKGMCIIGIDHALILSQGAKDMHALYNALVNLKKAGAYVFVLSQLNREIMSEKRIKDQSNLAKVYETDIYGSDVVMQYSDVVIALDRPYLRGINIYGKEGIIVESDSLIIRYLKNRKGHLGLYKYKLMPNFEVVLEQVIEDTIPRPDNNNTKTIGETLKELKGKGDIDNTSSDTKGEDEDTEEVVEDDIRFNEDDDVDF